MKKKIACWVVICRKPKQDTLLEGIIYKVYLECLETHSHAILYHKHFLWSCLPKCVYDDNCKHIMEMTEVELFTEFKERNYGRIFPLAYLMNQICCILGPTQSTTLVLVDTMLKLNWNANVCNCFKLQFDMKLLDRC